MNYPEITKIQLRFSDTDNAGIINNTIFYQFFEVSRLNFFVKLGIKDFRQEDSESMIVAGNSCDYISPMYFTDNVYVKTRIKKIGNSSLTFEQLIIKKIKDQEIELAKGKTTVVSYDYSKKKSIKLPSWLIKNIKKIQPNI